MRRVVDGAAFGPVADVAPRPLARRGLEWQRLGKMEGAMRNILMLALAIGLAGCGVTERLGGGPGKVRGDKTMPYRTVLIPGDDGRSFVVQAEAPGVALDALRESVRLPATRYCLETYGGSDVDWTLDPATGDWLSTSDGEHQVFSGTCLAR